MPVHIKNNIDIYLLRALLLVLIGVTIYTLELLQKSSLIYDDISTSLTKDLTVIKTTKVGAVSVDIPSYELFHVGNIWTIVSKDRPFKGEVDYDLIDIPVAHGDADKPMKIAKNISNDLQQLVNAAEADDEPLMVSSAYRSLEEQREIQIEFISTQGAAAAAIYVLPPGASEHHTGLSVDFSSVSDECANDSDACSLSQSSASWLNDNAYRFGFILRYPEHKRDVTGVGYEPWHFRFVGRPLARAISESNLTLEEVTEQIAPGYAKKL